MASAIENPKAAKKAAEEALTAGWYHFGMLPASGKVKWPVPKKNVTFGESEFGLHEFEPWALWNNAGGMEKGLSIFVAKARAFLGMTVRGFHFPSTSLAVEQNGEDISKTAYPGNATKLSASAVRAVIDSCYKHIVRVPRGIERVEEFGQSATIIDMAHGTKPAHWSDEEWREYKMEHAIPDPATFDPITDRYVADFVYLYRLPVTEEPDLEAYEKNPNVVHIGWIGRMQKKFFDTPPKSVTEMYPQAGA